jgi:hypothetical protein
MNGSAGHSLEISKKFVKTGPDIILFVRQGSIIIYKMFPRSLTRIQKALAIGGALLILIVGIGLLASYALPGDALYGVKINVLEKIPSFLAFGSQSKESQRISLVKNRTNEFVTLLIRGDITPQKRVKLASLFINNIDEVRGSILSLKNNDDLIEASHEIASLRGALQGYMRAFLEIRSQQSKNREELDEFGIGVENEIAKLASLNGEITSAITSKNDAGFVSAARTAADETREILNDIKSFVASQEAKTKLSPDEIKSVGDRLQYIASSLDAAVKSIDAKKYAEALITAHQALLDASQEDVLLAVRLQTR